MAANASAQPRPASADRCGEHQATRATVRAKWGDYTFVCPRALPGGHRPASPHARMINSQPQPPVSSLPKMCKYPSRPARTGKRVVVADELGYCWGVRRALDIIEAAAESAGRSRRSATSSTTRRSSSDCASRASRARARSRRPPARVQARRDHRPRHGSASGGRSRQRELELIDTTCPLVTKVQRLAQKLVRQGYFLVVYGDSYHPEVKSVIGWAGTSNAVAAKKIADLPWNAPRGDDGRRRSAPRRARSRSSSRRPRMSTS